MARAATARPACGARVVRRGLFRSCPNSIGCPAQRVRAIQHFASRDAFDIDGLGPSTVRLLVERGLVQTAADLFTLTDDDLRALPRFGPIAAMRLVAAIDRARRVELHRFLLALGIPTIGAATAMRLAEHFHTLPAFRRASVAQLAAVPGAGPAAAREIGDVLRQPGSQDVIDALLRHGVTVKPHRKRDAGTSPLEIPVSSEREFRHRYAPAREGDIS